jgi:hypothetical protein
VIEHVQIAVFLSSEEPLDAARQFYEQTLPGVREVIEAESSGGAGLKSIAFIFQAADHTHRAWRLAAVQALAREFAPGRVNAIEGDTDLSHDAIEEALNYLRDAPGITGQLLAV